MQTLGSFFQRLQAKNLRQSGLDCGCVFPFVYNGKKYDSCTTVDYPDYPWCAMDSVYQPGRYQICDQDCEKDCRSSYYTHEGYFGKGNDCYYDVDYDSDWCCTNECCMTEAWADYLFRDYYNSDEWYNKCADTESYWRPCGPN